MFSRFECLFTLYVALLWGSSVRFSLGDRPIAPCFKNVCAGAGGGGGVI